MVYIIIIFIIFWVYSNLAGAQVTRVKRYNQLRNLEFSASATALGFLPWTKNKQNVACCFSQQRMVSAILVNKNIAHHQAFSHCSFPRTGSPEGNLGGKTGYQP